MGFSLYGVEMSNKLIYVIGMVVITVIAYLCYYATNKNDPVKLQTFKSNNSNTINNISVDSVRPSSSASVEKGGTVDKKIWDSGDQTETWPNELTTADLKIEPFHAKKSVGFR